MHELSRELSGNGRPSLLNVMRNVAKRFDGAYSLVLLNACGEMLVARDPLGHQAAQLCHRRGLVRRRQRERGTGQPGFRSRADPVARARDGDCHQRWTVDTRTFCRQVLARPIASSSGSTLPTSPARWTIAAFTSRAPPWAKNWRGWNEPTEASRWMNGRSSCRCPTPARQRPTRWPFNCGFPAVRG